MNVHTAADARLQLLRYFQKTAAMDSHLLAYCQAVNDEGGEVNDAFDHVTRNRGTIPAIAKSFKARAQPWALIVDENYGEGSAREHAALQPRFYGAFT